MNVEPHVTVITRHSVSRVATLLREVGYLVTKMAPDPAGDCARAEALIVDLGLFDLFRWLRQHNDDDRILIIAPPARLLKGVTARILRTTDVEDDLVSAVDRIVADQRIAAHREQRQDRREAGGATAL